MDDLIIRVLQGRAPAEETVELRRQREDHFDVERRYRELQQIWALTAVAGPASHHRAVPDAEALIRRADARTTESNTSRPAVWFRLVKAGALAACLAALGFGIGRY